jgi:lysophospholipase L1-like esterase
MKNLKLVLIIFLFALITEEFTQAQNWANIKYYQDANAKLGLPTPGEDRIVFMGNSITELWGYVCPDFFANRAYINRGISGQTTPQMLVRFRADVINLKPALVLILAGTNDIAGVTGPSTLEMIMGNIISMAELARANGIKVILCSVLPAYDYPWKPGIYPAEKILNLNEMIKDYADKHGIIYLDYYSSMVDERKGLKADYTTPQDGVHPNEAGYRLMAPLAEAAISKALLQK